MIKLDFSRIAYFIEDAAEEENVIDRFSDLKLQAEVFEAEDDLPEGVSADKVLRYLIYMYAPNSPIKDAFPDINNRKKYTFNKLNIDHEEVVGYSELALMNQEWAIKRFVAFTRLQCSEDYGLLETSLQRMATLQAAILSQAVDKSTDDKNYQEGLERWRTTGSAARSRIMQDETSVTLQKAVTFSASASSLGIRPEEYTRVWRDKKELWNEIIP